MSNDGKGSIERAPARKANSVDRNIGKCLKLRREVLGLTESDVASRAGISRRQLEKYEHGENRVPASRLMDFARILDAPVSYFFQDKQVSGRPPAATNVVPFASGGEDSEAADTRDEEALLDHFRALTDGRDRQLVVQLAVRLSCRVKRP
ncbi:MAG: helix-turn-helix transcriptional regulator [Hyphomicrobiaceae bacterium]